jgi:hypothetical protein
MHSRESNRLASLPHAGNKKIQRIRISTFPFPENKLMFGGKENGFNNRKKDKAKTKQLWNI